ncbi:MAG: 3-deoxy-7-phosphoheptulonate synthase [Flammeovirgaceae bacterium]|nr:3-deoxy-7-phosphoheptulonate synthase [Flammeovirgaceae bacterium]|tara:strand:- start:1292 stop:2290 length:999 start_codon:yes stop_codon:yes gene_type:complete
MIIHLKDNIGKESAENIAKDISGKLIYDEDKYIIITSSKKNIIPKKYENKVDESFIIESDIQLSSRNYINETRKIKINNIEVGGDSMNTLMITGPCSIENKDQIEKCAKLLKENRLTTLRAGCFKPRTSPYSFQGLGLEGLKMLSDVRDKYGFNIISEVKDTSHVSDVIEYTDIIQIGAKAMYDHGILRETGRQKKPVLLKRGFGSNLQEFVQAAEFILSEGNPNVMLCERGIRTFETKTRFTLDLCGVSFLKEHTNLPIILDTSHAMGYSYGVPDLTRACVAMGIDGLLIESHPDPSKALSDASQQLNFQEFNVMFESLKPICKAVNRNLI